MDYGINSEIDRNIHDDVFIQSIDRKERLIRLLTSKLDIPEVIAREDASAVEIVKQLLREGNPILEGSEEDAWIFLSDFEVKEDIPVFRSGSKYDNSAYDREKAKKYIDTYWKSYNTAYPSFSSGGGDCANFVSQVLYAGGMTWVDDGKPLHYTWYTNWYCKPGATARDGDRRISLSWKVASAFKSHWIKRAEKNLAYSYGEALNKMDEIAAQVYAADVVQFCYSSGVPFHTLVVTGFARDADTGKNDIVLASHTLDSNSRSLLNTVQKYPADYILRLYVIKQRK